MVKADLTRDYYADLELPQNADANEIKKQFKKLGMVSLPVARDIQLIQFLALQYHPDRNPGRESEVTAKFQRIQSAHEVLTDTHERAKYDSNRIRPSNVYRTGGNARGNPWSNVSSQYPTPPKPPTARARPAQPPPPSAGAQRYKNFGTPRQTANQTEGAEARRSTYEAWERMRERGPPPSASNKPAPPPKRTPRTGHDKNRHPPDPSQASPRPSQHGRSHSQNSSNRKGFTPNTPGGDEPAAPRAAYYTQRDKPAHAPHSGSDDQYSSVHEQASADPLKHFREKPSVQFEPRISTPYATHGGEKFNPFESVNMNRSKSTREPSNKYAADGMPRVGSDSNLNSSNRHRTQDPGFSRPRPNSTYAAPDSDDDSSSDEGPQITRKAAPKPPMTTTGQRSFPKARSFTGTRTRNGQFTAPSHSVNGQQPSDGSNQSHNTCKSSTAGRGNKPTTLSANTF